jgi:glycosyltransferase involved in cell wall biosynthesis
VKCAPAIRLMMTADAVGGVWVFAVNLARALGAAGHQVILVTLGPRPAKAQRDAVAGHPGVFLVETDLQLEWQDPAGSDLSRARAVLGDIADRLAPDLIHLNGFREATFDWKVPTIVTAHSCVNSWAFACGECESFTGSEWRVYSANVEAGLHNTNAWVAPTRAFREVLASRYGPPTEGHAVWNGVDGTGCSPLRKRPVILGAGRVWDRAKNLSAFSSIASEIDWPIRIAGPRGLGGGERLAATDGCEFLGEISHDELLREMGSASIFVSPALYEPFGLSVLEAARAGCALLLADIPTFRELWDGAAVFFDPRDGEALRRSLRVLCGDEVQRTVLQRAGMARARRYPLHRTVSRYRTIYQSVLATQPLRAGSTQRAEMSA